MTVHRPFVLLTWIAVALLARVALRPGAPPPGAGVAESLVGGAPLCGAHDCGCPHDVVPESCCCAGEVERAPAAPPRARPAADLARPVGLGAAAGSLPGPVLESAECSGPRGRTSAPVGPAPVALMPPPAVIVAADGAGWMPVLEDGPPSDAGTEPPTPPPRGIRG